MESYPDAPASTHLSVVTEVNMTVGDSITYQCEDDFWLHQQMPSDKTIDLDCDRSTGKIVLPDEWPTCVDCKQEDSMHKPCHLVSQHLHPALNHEKIFPVARCGSLPSRPPNGRLWPRYYSYETGSVFDCGPNAEFDLSFDRYLVSGQRDLPNSFTMKCREDQVWSPGARPPCKG